MTTEDMIEEFISQGMCAYKKLNRNTPEGKSLEQHHPVTIEGYTFSCWREYAVYKTAEFIKSKIPEGYIEVELDGNNSSISVEISDLEQRKLNGIMFSYLKKISA